MSRPGRPQARLNIKDLKRYLARTRLTPEQFAKNVKLSHMTIRRWLKREDTETLPSKYLSILGPIFGKIPVPELPKLSLSRALKNLSMDVLINEIETAGRGFKDFKILKIAVADKLSLIPADKTLESCCQQLLKAAESSRTNSKARAIATGALIYFVDPIGVPDDTPLTGYLGELAVLSVALNAVYFAECN